MTDSQKSLSPLLSQPITEKTLRQLLAEIVSVMNGRPEKYEVIFVNDGSKDDSQSVLKALASENPNGM